MGYRSWEQGQTLMANKPASEDSKGAAGKPTKRKWNETAVP